MVDDPSKGTGFGPGEASTRRFVGSMDRIDQHVGDRSVGYTMSDGGVTKTVVEHNEKSTSCLSAVIVAVSGVAAAYVGAKYGIGA